MALLLTVTHSTPQPTMRFGKELEAEARPEWWAQGLYVDYKQLKHRWATGAVRVWPQGACAVLERWLQGQPQGPLNRRRAAAALPARAAPPGICECAAHTSAC